MKRFSLFVVLGLLVVLVGCDLRRGSSSPPKSTSGVQKATVKVKTNAEGLTTEQVNIARRLTEENKLGAIKHLYVISAMSGQVILYSTVKCKPTSSGKRLSPITVSAMDGQYVDGDHQGIPVNIGGYKRRTTEVLQDDGTYGSSIPYLYWWDVQDRYHQHYVSGGQIIHVSDQPLSVGSITINMETQGR